MSVPQRIATLIDGSGTLLRNLLLLLLRQGRVELVDSVVA